MSCLSLFLCWCKTGMKPIKSTSENMVHLRKGPGLDSSFSHRNLQLVLVWYLLKMPLMWSLLSHSIPEEKTVPVSSSARCTPLECLFQLDRLITFVLLFMVLKPVFNPHPSFYHNSLDLTVFPAFSTGLGCSLHPPQTRQRGRLCTGNALITFLIVLSH